MEIKENSLLKETPDYEQYTENVVKISLEELKELGLLECGCSKKANYGCASGCNCNKKCCRNE